MSEMLTPLSDSRHTKAEGKFTPQICRSRIFVPANECTRVVPMYPSQSAMSHLHSLAQSMYIATFLPKHVIPTCFADYVTSTSGAIRLAFDLSPWPQVHSFWFEFQNLLAKHTRCTKHKKNLPEPFCTSPEQRTRPTGLDRGSNLSDARARKSHEVFFSAGAEGVGR